MLKRKEKKGKEINCILRKLRGDRYSFPEMWIKSLLNYETIFIRYLLSHQLIS